MSVRENALVALKGLLENAVPNGALVLRNATEDALVEVPESGVVNLTDGNLVAKEEYIGVPKEYDISWQAVVELVVQHPEEGVRSARLEALLASIVQEIEGDFTLGGLVSRAAPDVESIDHDAEVEGGGEHFGVATVPVVLEYTTDSALG